MRAVWREMGRDGCLDLAARVSYYFVLALFPALIILAAILSYSPIGQSWSAVVHWVAHYSPPGSRGALVHTLESLSRGRGGFLSFGVASAAWSASTGIVALMGALNVVHGVQETRGFVRQKALALGMLVVLCFCFLLAFALQVSAGSVASALQAQAHLGDLVIQLWRAGAWLVSIVLLALGVSLIETVLPNARRPWKWLTAGGVFSSLYLFPRRLDSSTMSGISVPMAPTASLARSSFLCSGFTSRACLY